MSGDEGENLRFSLASESVPINPLEEHVPEGASDIKEVSMKLRYLRNISSLAVVNEKCIGCAMCIDVCPHDVFRIEGKRVRIIDKDACMECGACKRNCPFSAIEVTTGTGGLVPVLEEMMQKKA